MTLSHRNRYLTVVLILGLGLLVGLALFFYWVIQSGFWEIGVQTDLELHSWLGSFSAAEVFFRQDFPAYLIWLATTMISGALMRRTFRKTASAESFFLAIFCFSLSWEALRLISFSVIWLGQSVFFLYLITKVVYFFRFLSTFFFLLAGLFNYQFSYQKFGTLILISSITSALMSIFLPISTGELDASLLLLPYSPTILGAFLLMAGLVGLSGFAFPLNFQKNARYLVTALGILIMLASQHLFYFRWTVYPASALLFLGTWIVSRRLERSHLLG